MSQLKIFLFTGLIAAVVGFFVPVAPAQAQDAICSYGNPLLDHGQDPSLVYHDGYYYLVQSEDVSRRFSIRKSETLTGLRDAEPVTIFVPPPGTPYTYDMWAPELVYLQGAWYLYFAADDQPGNNDMHRTFVLKADTDDPTGSWSFMGPLFTTPELDKWAIDFVPFEYEGQLYGVWSGTGDESLSGAAFPQVLYIATMSDPLTISSDRVKLVVPDEPWESSVAAIAEGPEPYLYDGQLSIVYSADASWTREYKLALLRLDGEDLLDPESWTKVGVIFEGYENENGAVYGVGHNSMPFTSPDGSEWWMAYHAKTLPQDGWEDRNVRLHPFIWNEDGTPNFGTPIPIAQSVSAPSGESCGLVATFSFDAPPVLEVDEAVEMLTEGAPEAVEGYDGQGMKFDGDDAFATDGALVDTAESYSVAAWVQLEDTDGSYTILSQEGGLFSAFRLHVNAETNGAFAFTVNDMRGNPAASAVAPFTPEVGVWYHVVGVRDAVDNAIDLYVDGELVASAPFSDDWSSQAGFIIGGAKARAQRTDLFKGVIDEVQVYDGALSSEAIAALSDEGA